MLILFLGTSLKAVDLSVKRFKNKEYISLYDIVKKLNIDSTFDIVSNSGRIYYRNHNAVYRTGYSLILIDGRLYKSGYPIVRKNGEVLLPFHMTKNIIERFYRGSSITRKRYSLDIQLRKIDHEKVTYKRMGKGKDRIGFIIIDPGHGGKDPGAIGKGGVKEKHIAFKIARYIKYYLRKRLPSMRIRITRSSDRFAELSWRTDYANRYLKKGRNGIFLSIHVNASISKRISGFETYFLSQNPTNEEARNTAALENNVIVLEEKKGRGKKYFRDVDYVEAMMITTQIQKESSLLANSVQRGMRRNMVSLKSRGVKKADFFVLRGVLMPASLVEVGYITNPGDLRYLRKKKNLRNIARGITHGIVVFIRKYNRIIRLR
ncbi:N-acetylmuramoyl-L-alanine amidase [Spirochaetota bacterium]